MSKIDEHLIEAGTALDEFETHPFSGDNFFKATVFRALRALIKAVRELDKQTKTSVWGG